MSHNDSEMIIVGKLIYLTNTRVDVDYVISVISCFMSDLTQMHLDAYKHVLKYMKGKFEFGIYYRKRESCEKSSSSNTQCD